MRTLRLRAGDKDSVEKAVKSLKRILKPGDVILTSPIRKNIMSRYFHITLMLTKRVLKSVTHSCIYLGNDMLLDIDYKIVRPGGSVEELTLRDFISGKLHYFGGVSIYVVSPKQYSIVQRRIAVQESREKFIANRKKLSLSIWESFLVGFRYVFYRKSRYKEDLSFRNDWTCGHMVAYILKSAKVDIGKRASYTFVPPMFLYSKNFQTKSKIVMK